MDDFSKWQEITELRNWLYDVKEKTRADYISVMRLYQKWSGLNAKQLIDEAEEELKKPRRERGAVKQRLKSFYDYLTKEYRTGKGKTISKYRAKVMINSLRGFYKKNGFPVEIRIENSAPRRENARIELSVNDIKRMLNVAPTNRDKALILFGFQGAFDVKTVSNLRFFDFEKPRGEDILNAVRNYRGDVEAVLKDLPTPWLLHVVREKEGIDYHTCIGCDAAKALIVYVWERITRGEEVSLNSPVFVKEGYQKNKGERITKNNVHDTMREVVLKAGIVSKERLEKADINPCGFHALRATFSRRLEYAGMPVAYIDYCQGHALPHGGAYRRPNPDKLIEKYREFEHVLSLSEVTNARELEEKFREEIEKLRVENEALKERIINIEREIKKLSLIVDRLVEVKL